MILPYSKQEKFLLQEFTKSVRSGTVKTRHAKLFTMINNFIEKVFKGKYRKSGKPYVTHLYAVRDILVEAGVTQEYILKAALLHDVLEDTNVTKEELAMYFGNTVADMVEFLSKEKIWHTSYCKLKSYVYTLEQIATDYPEVILIKMADRLHNLQTIEVFSQEKQKEYLKETTHYLFPIFFLAACHAPEKKPFFVIKNLLQQEIRKICISLFYPHERQIFSRCCQNGKSQPYGIDDLLNPQTTR